MSPPGVSVTAVTVSTEPDKEAIKRLSSSEIQIDLQTYKLIRDEDRLSFCQQFPDSIALTSESRITLHYKERRWKILKNSVTQTVDVRALLASADGSQPKDISVVEQGIRVAFIRQTTDATSASNVPEAVPSTSQSTGALVPVTQTMLKDASRFRILVIGKSGVGKSSLINIAFGIEKASISDFQRGKADIHEGLKSPVNERFILHDSVGIEPGDGDKYQIVKDFIQSRKTGPLEERLHAIWFCIQTPYAGGRLLEAGAEDFFRSKQQILGSIPLIVVFTKSDKAVNTFLMKPSSDDLDDETMTKNAFSKVESIAKQGQDEITRLAQDSKPIPYSVISTERGYEHTLESLIKRTDQEVGIGNTAEAQATSVLTQMAQRLDPRLKIRGTIDIGRKKYWKALRTGPDFGGHMTLDCLSVIHADIVAVWNFNDPARHLHDKEFKELVINLVQEMETHPVPDLNKTLFGTVTSGSLVSAVSSFISNPIAPFVLPIVMGAAAAAWLYEVYQNVKNVQQKFIAFIVDLTHIMEILFILNARTHHKLTRRAIKDAYRIYHESDVVKQVHAYIQTYRDGPGRDTALEMIEFLIKHDWDGSSEVQEYYTELERLDVRQLNMSQDEAW